MKQPIDQVEWIDARNLKANAYNPNYVAKTELELLKTSLLEDGWTQPIVATKTGEIVDGYHRWTLAKDDTEVNAMTGGMVPVVTLDKSLEHRMMSTIRHNRARGVHNILSMSKISKFLHDQGIESEEITRRLGMDREEFQRLTDNILMTDHGKDEDYSRSWLPTFETDEDVL
jgi:ParB-like chromosome segregation protein Spo0J